MPLGTQTFQFPQSFQDIGAIVPRAQGRFFKEQLDGILCRVVVTHDERHGQFSTGPNKNIPSQGFVHPNGAATSMSCPPTDTCRERLFLAGNTASNPSGRLESSFHLRTWSRPR